MLITSKLNQEEHKKLIEEKEKLGLTINPKISQEIKETFIKNVSKKIDGKFEKDSELVCLLNKMSYSKRIQNKQILRILSLLEEDIMISVTDEEHLKNGFSYFN